MPIAPRHPLLPLLRKVGTELRKRRVQLDFTQEELAFEAHVSVTVVKLIEAGRQNFEILTLFKVAKPLNVPLGDLFRGSANGS